MMKFAKHVYGECKETVLGGQNAFGMAAGLYIGSFYSRTKKLIKKTYEVEPELVKLHKDLKDNVKKLENNILSVNNEMEEHSETLGSTLELKLRSAFVFGVGCSRKQRSKVCFGEDELLYKKETHRAFYLKLVFLYICRHRLMENQETGLVYNNNR